MSWSGIDLLAGFLYQGPIP